MATTAADRADARRPSSPANSAGSTTPTISGSSRCAGRRPTATCSWPVARAPVRRPRLPRSPVTCWPGATAASRPRLRARRPRRRNARHVGRTPTYVAAWCGCTRRERVIRLLHRLRRAGAHASATSPTRRYERSLVIDGLDTVRRTLDDLDSADEFDALDEVLANAEHAGIAIVASVEHVAAVPATLLARCPNRWVFHLHDAARRRPARRRGSERPCQRACLAGSSTPVPGARRRSSCRARRHSSACVSPARRRRGIGVVAGACRRSGFH